MYQFAQVNRAKNIGPSVSRGLCFYRLGQPHPLALFADENLEQLVKVGLSGLDEHPFVAANGYCHVAARVRPALLRYPVHLAQFREGASQRVEHHRNRGAELGRHIRHLARHVRVCFEAHHLSIRGELTSSDDAVNLDQFIQCCNVFASLRVELIFSSIAQIKLFPEYWMFQYAQPLYYGFLSVSTALRFGRSPNRDATGGHPSEVVKAIPR